MRRLLRPLARLALFGVALVLALHLALLAAWHWEILPSLETAPNAHRLHTPSLEVLPSPAPWAGLRVDGLVLRAPILAPEAAPCDACVMGCILPLDGGRLTVFDVERNESYGETIRLLAPDVRDVSPLRPPWRNWEAIQAIATRVAIGNELPPTARFENPGSQGVVSFFSDHGVERYVIYAYARDGSSARAFALSGTDRETLLRVLGGTAVEQGRPGLDDTSSCATVPSLRPLP